MKKIMKYILALVIILPFLIVGCQKNDTIDEDNPLKRGDVTAFSLEDEIEYCGDPYIASLTDWEQTKVAGNVTVGNDETNLYVTFEVADDDWSFASTILYVGPLDDAPGGVYPSGERYFNAWEFPYIKWHWEGTELYTFTIPLDALDDCFIVVAYSNVFNKSTGEEFIVWGKSNLKSGGYYFDYCIQECEPPPYDCETAYAYGDEIATCFLDIPEVNSNNWGWSNGPISEGTYSWDIYAGAGQCNIDNATLVGMLDVDYSGGSVTVTYNIDQDFTMEENHLFIGEDGEMLPRKKNGKYTTAPGQFPYSGQTSYTIDGLSGDIYVVAHSVVCGDYSEE